MYIKMLVFSVNFNGRTFKYSLYNLTILPALTYDDIIHACIMSSYVNAGKIVKLYSEYLKVLPLKLTENTSILMYIPIIY